MDEDFLITGLNEVGMDVVDCEVVGIRVVDGCPVEVACFDGVTVCGEQIVAFVDISYFLPLVVCFVPEVVILRGCYRSAQRPQRTLRQSGTVSR